MPRAAGRRRDLTPSDYDDYYSYYSESRSPTPRPRRSHRDGGRRGGHGDRRASHRSRSRGRRDRGGRDDRGGYDRRDRRDRDRDRDGGRGRSRGRDDRRGGGGGYGGGSYGGSYGGGRPRSPVRPAKPPARSPSRDGDPPNDWIINMLIDREKARIDRDWAEADRVRDELRNKGIEIYDRERRWEAKDGRVGLRPNHDDRKRGPGARSPARSGARSGSPQR